MTQVGLVRVSHEAARSASLGWVAEKGYQMVTRVAGFEAESMDDLGRLINEWLAGRRANYQDLGDTRVDAIAFASATYPGDDSPGLTRWGALVTARVPEGVPFP